MTLVAKGLGKLVEECGELSQIAAKKMQYMDTDEHPDGKGSMKNRMEEEIADVLAACAFAIQKFDLEEEKIEERAMNKFFLFSSWDGEPDDIH